MNTKQSSEDDKKLQLGFWMLIYSINILIENSPETAHMRANLAVQSLKEKQK